jgi:hypothetical protein
MVTVKDVAGYKDGPRTKDITVTPATPSPHLQRTLPWHRLPRRLTSKGHYRDTCCSVPSPLHLPSELWTDLIHKHQNQEILEITAKAPKKIPQTLRDFCLRLPAPDLQMYMDLKYAYLLARYCWCVEFKLYCSEYFIDLNGLVMLLVTDEACEIRLIYIHLLLSTCLSSIINQRYWLRFLLRNFGLNNTMDLAQVS